MCVRQACTIGGSGSSYIYGFIKEFYREGMKKEECVEFVKKAVFHAMYHDGSSGGVCRIGVITKDGIERSVNYAPKENITSLSTKSSIFVSV